MSQCLCVSVVDPNPFARGCDNILLLVPRGRNSTCCYELLDSRNESRWLVLLDNMSTVSYYIHFVLSLHMSYRERCIHTLRSRKDEHLLCSQAKEDSSEALEPLSPVFFSRQKICSPYILHCTCLFVCLLNNLGRHRDSSAFLVFYLSAEDTELDYGRQIWEGFRSISYDLFHKWQSFHSRTFNYIDYYDSETALLNICSCHLFLKVVDGLGRDCTSHRMTYYNDRAIWISLVDKGQDFNCVINERRLGHVGLIFTMMVSMSAPVKADDCVFCFQLFGKHRE